MADLLPSSAEVEPPEAGPRVLGVDSDDADDVIAALSSETARSLLAALHDEPATPSELAERADTSLQNTQYHLEKLTAAELVEVCGTRYSEKGREMNVYAPADGPLVLLPESESAESEGLREALGGLLGAGAVLGVGSLVVQRLLGDGGSSSQTAALTTASTVEESTGLPPGLVFFLGGLLVLALVGVFVAYRT